MPRLWDVPVHDSTRVRDARVAAEEAAAAAGLDAARTADAALVATELATNLLKHARGGRLVLDVVPAAGPGGPAAATAVQIAALDHGPGMADVATALGDGFSTAGSLGAGLGTCRRLADDFTVHSVPGRGTVAVARVGAAGADGTGGRVRVGGLNVPYAGADHSGDAWTCVADADRVTLMMADGLGHGVEAARASTAAVEALRGAALLSPAAALARLDTALRGTRGAAVAVAQLDGGVLRFAGVGNIGARLKEGDDWRPLLSRPGIVGVHRPGTLRETELPWDGDRLLVLHSDGLPSRWVPSADPGLLRGDPAVLAAVTIRDAGGPASPVRDDTAVAVLSPAARDRR
ncbi:SpoIIE family protein phosphatase [Streptomyces sp. ACT015]|uniref:SpoIIE family protein phosphatase n=1 Tax=Streptomyces sp. ACT015 TaxID=3134807 RepID=UPI003D1684DF